MDPSTPDPSSLTPNGLYKTWVVHNGIVYVSGMTPRVDGEVAVAGRVGEEVSIESAHEAAEIAARRILACLNEAGGGLDSISQILTLTVFVACAPSFTDHSRIADRVSAVLLDAMGERARSSRVAIGVQSLPGNAVLEIAVSAALATEGRSS